MINATLDLFRWIQGQILKLYDSSYTSQPI
jgi:hypothetical protein